MDAGRVNSGDRAYVPNRYAVAPESGRRQGVRRRTGARRGRARRRAARTRAGARLPVDRAPAVRLGYRTTWRAATSRSRPRPWTVEQLKRIDGHDERLQRDRRHRLRADRGRGAPWCRGMHVAPIVPAQATPGRDRGGRPAAVGGPSPAAAAGPRSCRSRPRPTGCRQPATPPTGAYVRVGTRAGLRSAASPETPKRADRHGRGANRRPPGRNPRLRWRHAARRPGTRQRAGACRRARLAPPRAAVSRRGVLVYADLGSTNGSYVNGTRVREIVLGSGDVVRLGNSTLTIQSQA